MTANRVFAYIVVAIIIGSVGTLIGYGLFELVNR